MKMQLDIFIFQLLKKVNGKYSKEPSNFNEIHKLLSQSYPNKTPMAALLQAIIKDFDTSSFQLNAESSKAICFQNMSVFNIQEDQNYISGRFLGGNTGQQYDVYDNSDSTTVTHIVKPTEVASLPFYFLLWKPKGFTTGVLIVHRYSTSSCLSLFNKCLRDFFKNLGYKFYDVKFSPRDVINKFLQNCTITQIGISYKKGLNNELKPQVDLLKGNSILAKINNISLSAKKLIEDISYKHKVTNEISEIFPNFDSNLHNLKFYYVNSKGETASSTIDELNCLLPSVCLDVNCVNSNNTPDWKEIEKVALDYLHLIQVDLKYKTHRK